MQHSTLTKALTLLSSAFLITAFLMYRAGSFNAPLSAKKSQLQTSPNGGTIKPGKTDSLVIPKMDSVSFLRMASSKSMVLIEPQPGFWDSIKPKRKTVSVKKTVTMSSSKSSIIFTPRIDFNLDSIKFDIKKLRQTKN